MNNGSKLHIQNLIASGETKEAIVYINNSIDSKNITQKRDLNNIASLYYSNLKRHSLQLTSYDEFSKVNNHLNNLIIETFVDDRLINSIKFVEVLNFRKVKNDKIESFELVIKNNLNENLYLDNISLKSFMLVSDFKKKYPEKKKGTATSIGVLLGGAIILASAVVLTGGAAAPVIPMFGVELGISIGLGAVGAGALTAGIGTAITGGIIDIMSKGESVVLKGDVKNSLDGKVRNATVILSLQENILYYELIIPCSFFLEPGEICSLDITMNASKTVEKSQIEKMESLPMTKESQIIFFCDSGTFSTSETEVESLKILNQLI